MSYVFAILGLIGAIILWVLMQRWDGRTLEARQDAKNAEGCDSCAVASSCTVPDADGCDDHEHKPPRKSFG